MKFLKCEKIKERKNKRVAIIGAGPAGLFAAGVLICEGWQVHVYEKLPEPGGLMIFGALDSSIDKEKIRRGIKELETAGVVFHLSTLIDDKKFEKLKDEFDVVLIATGTWKSRRLGIQSESLKGVFYALDYITNYHMYKYGYLKEIEKLTGKTVVVGGGLTAVDVCYVAKEMGSSEVVLSYRRRVDESKAKNELRKLEKIGVKFLELTQPVRIEGTERVKRIVLAKTKIVGAKVETIPGTEFSVPADNVIIAVGETPSPAFDDIETDENGKIKIDSNFMTNVKGVFAAGDVEQGTTSIGKAMLRGIEAGKAIHRYLQGLLI